MASEAKLLTVQFLRWVAERPRHYGEMRNAWSSTCPLTCAWEDAIGDDLVRRTADGQIVLTNTAARGSMRQPCLSARAEYRSGPPLGSLASVVPHE